MPSEELLLTVNEAARRLSLSRSIVYRLIATGDLPSVKIGGSRRVPTSGLRDFVQITSDGSLPPSRRRRRRVRVVDE